MVTRVTVRFPMSDRSCVILIEVTVYWLHSLCKNIELVYDKGGDPSIQDPRNSRYLQGGPMSQDDGTWRRSGYFIRWKQPPITGGGDGMVELVVFSPSSSLQMNLESLVPRPNWEEALTDPFCLLIVILDDIFRQVDDSISKVLVVFGPMERVCCSSICKPMTQTKSLQAVLQSDRHKASKLQFDFVGIHNIAKHIIHLKESSSAAYSTADHIYEQHRELIAQPQGAHTSKVMRNVQRLLRHKLSLLEGSRLRVQSMENRVQNTINLVRFGSTVIANTEAQ